MRDFVLVEKKLMKNKHFWIMVVFWMLVGASSRAFYDLQVLFEGIFGSASYANYALAGAGLFAAVVGGPIIGILVDKYKRYKTILICVMCFMIVTLLTLPLFGLIKAEHTYILLIILLGAPMVGIGYSYRAVLDPFATSYTQTHKIPTTITRGFYSVGAGVFSAVILTLIKYTKSNNYSIQTMYILFSVYISTLLILMLYIILRMEEPEHGDKRSRKVDMASFKETFKNKVFWVGLIAMFFLIGTTESLDSLNKHVAFEQSRSWGDENNVIMYVDLIRIIPESLFFIFTSLMFMRYGIRKSGVVASVALMAGSALLGAAVYFNVKWLFIIATALLTPLLASLSMGLGYEFVVSESSFSLRGIAGTIFNAITYGLGGATFFLVNGPLFDANIGYVIYFIYSGLALIPFVIFVLLIPNIQTKVKMKK